MARLTFRRIALFATVWLILSNADAIAQPLPADSSSSAGRWWQWRISLPDLAVPEKDTAGHFCDVGQPHDMWFLAGLLTFDKSRPVRRHCNVPAGRQVFFPVMSAFRIVHDDVTCAKAQDEVSAKIDKARDLFATLDGRDHPISARDRSGTKSVCLPLKLAADGPSAKLTASIDGYWLSLGPLPPGRHTLAYGGSFSSGDKEVPRFQTTTYDLDVE